MNEFIRFDRFFPYGIPPALTVLVCLFLASLTMQTGRTKRVNKLFTIFCFLQAVLNIDMTLLTVLTTPSQAMLSSSISHMIYVFIIPVAIHFTHRVAGIKNRTWLEQSAYLFSLCLAPLTFTTYYQTSMREYYFGYYSIGGPAFLIFGLVGIFATIYIIHVLWRQFHQSSDLGERFKLRLIFWGFSSNLVLTLGNLLPLVGIKVYPLGNLGFIPMALMAYGVLKHQLLNITRSWIKEGYITRLLAWLSWSPLLAAIIYWFTAREGTFHSDIAHRIIPYSIPPILSFLTCFTLASLCFLRGRRRTETILFGLTCVLWGGLNLDKTMGALVTSGDIALQITRIDHFFLVLQLGIYAHFTHYFVNFPRWGVYLFYSISAVLMPITQTNWYYQGFYDYYWGFSAQKNIGLSIFGLITLMMIFWVCIFLYKAARSARDRMEKNKYYIFSVGAVLTALLSLGNIPSLGGVEIYPPGNFTFVPALFMAYGVFQFDIVKINIYVRRRIRGTISRVGIYLGYGMLIPVCLWALQADFYDVHGLSSSYLNLVSFDFILGRVIPYGLPPLISFLVALYLSTISLKFGQNRPESLIFGIMCMIIGFLNMDILLNCIVQNEVVGLQLNRWDHAFLVFSPAIYLHLVSLVIKRNGKRIPLYFAYTFSMFLLPFTQTDYYIHSMNHYYWGLFAKSGIVFHIFSFYSSIVLVYSFVQLLLTYRSSDNIFQKKRVQYIALGFAFTGSLTLGNVPAISGFEVYPMGNFAFIPLLLSGYGLFRHNLKETMQLTRKYLFWTSIGVGLLLAAAVLSRFPPIPWSVFFLTVSMAVIIFLYKVWYRVLDNLLRLFFGHQREELNLVLDRFILKLSQVHQIEEIYSTVREVAFITIKSSLFSFLVFPDSPTGGKTSWEEHPNGEGWESNNPRESIFSSPRKQYNRSIGLAGDHPLIPMLYKYHITIFQEHSQEWMLSHDVILPVEDFFRKAILMHPIFFEDRLRGLIILGEKIDGSVYSQMENDFLHQLALSLGPYIENAQLLHELEVKIEDRTRELQTSLLETKAKEKEISHINQVMLMVNSMHDLDEVLSSVMESLQEIFTFDQLGIMLLTDDNENLVFYKAVGNFSKMARQAMQQMKLSLKYEDSWFVKTFKERQPMYISGITPEISSKFEPHDYEIYQHAMSHSFVFYPLEVQRQVIGVIIFGNSDTTLHLDRQEIERVQRYVTQVAAAINNARMADEIKGVLKETLRKEKEIAHLNQVTQVVNSTLDYEKVAQAVTEALLEIFYFDQMSIQLVDDSTTELIFIKTYGQELTEAKKQEILNIRIPLKKRASISVAPYFNGKPVYIPKVDAETISLFSEKDKEVHSRISAKAYLFLPLKVQRQIIGVISFGNIGGYFDINDEDIIRINRYISPIATAINNARLYNDLNNARHEAVAATRAKSVFLANMSHEIRTPMNAIMGLTDLALRTDLNPKQLDYLTKIYESSDSLLDIINNILDFSKIEAGKLELEIVEFSVDDVIKKMIDMFSSKLHEKNIEMIVSVDPTIPEILKGDPLRLSQVLINLLSNAFKFTEEGELILNVKVQEQRDTNITLLFSVKDTGIGIAPEQRHLLFESFAQADGSTTRKYGGTGLGLTICKELTEMMGGEIHLQSELGKGSVFSFTAVLGCSKEAMRKKLVFPAKLKSLYALIVDDNRHVREIMIEMLHSFGVTARAAASAKEALKILAQPDKSKQFDLIFMDWKMPHMDGMECARTIRDLPDFQKVPLVMMTAFGREDIKSQAEIIGVDAFIFKPISSSYLFDTIANVFGCRLDDQHHDDSFTKREQKIFDQIRGGRVLLVEDNRINQQVALELLQSAELFVEIARNGLEACQKMETGSYDIVLMDLQMPVMDGYEACKTIRSNLELPQIPILAMTAHALSTDREKCLAIGMNDHISKPIIREVLFNKLERWLKPVRNNIPKIKKELKPDSNHDELPQNLPGLNIAKTIRNLGGNKELYLTILKDFCQQFASVHSDIDALLNKGEDALKLIHALKGVAGNIGAEQLFLTTEKLEVVVNKKQTLLIKNHMDLMDDELKLLLDSLGKLGIGPN